MRHEEISRFKFESGRIVKRTRLIRSAFLSVRGKNDREENDGFGKAAKRRQEVARRGEREKERGREEGAGSGTTPPRAVCTIFFASRQRRPESRCFLG